MFYTVPKQFYQLWTISIVVDQHVIPAIHCLLAGKSQELYEAILFRIKSIVPRFNPQIAMSDWEIAPRNAFKQHTMVSSYKDVGFITPREFGKWSKSVIW